MVKMTKIESFSFIVSVFIPICAEPFHQDNRCLCFSFFSTEDPVAGFSIMAP
jgi:hypothetical protein